MKNITMVNMVNIVNLAKVTLLKNIYIHISIFSEHGEHGEPW